MRAEVIGRMGDGKTCSHRAIERQVMAAIKPQLDRADELLDYYTEGLPRDVWLPIAYQFKPKTQEEIQAEAAVKLFKYLAPKVRQWGQAIGAGIAALVAELNRPIVKGDVTESA